MHTRTTISCTAAALLLCTGTTGHAIDLGAAAELMYLDYEETDLDGSTLNRETGFIPGLSIAASGLRGKVSHSLEFSAYGGDVNYDGQTQAGQPHQTTTEQNIYRLQYRFSWPLERTDAELYGKVYWQQWDRDIQPNNGVLGLFERYEWWSIEAGTEVPLMRRERQNLLLGLGILATIDGTIMVDLSEAGFGKPVLDLGSDIGFTGELKYELQQANNSRLQFGLEYRTWRFGRSNSETLSNGSTFITITEPDSKTAQTIMYVSYIHHF